MERSSIQNVAAWLITISLTVFILIEYKSLLQPLVVALIIWYLVRVLRQRIQKIKVFKRTIPSWLSSLISFLLILGGLLGLSELLLMNIEMISEKLPAYQERWREILEREINLDWIQQFRTEIESQASNFDYQSLVGAIVTSLSNVIGNAFLIILYVGFLLAEEAIFAKKIDHLFKNEERQRKLTETLGRINSSIRKYLSLKTQVSLLTGFLSYFVMLIFGLDFAFLWAFLIFILNYIPYVGSFVATFLPAAFAILQFGSIYTGLFVFGAVEAVQLFVGNYLEPKIMGKGLNLSPIVVILALSFWGSVWGVLGMMLSVPIMSMIAIVLANFESSRNIAVFLSSDGKLVDGS